MNLFSSLAFLDGIRSTLGVCPRTMSQQLFIVGTGSARIVALNIGCRFELGSGLFTS